jgi:UDP-N-acetylmuramate--alanine ligase
MKTAKFARVHFVGIGGIGVSALARLFAWSGSRVTGSDLKESTVTQSLRQLGIPIVIGPHRAAHVPAKIDLLVHTNDAVLTNPEIQRAKRMGVPVKSYPQALPLMLRDQKIIGISGTHGKTTTTGMIGSILTEAAWDPTIVVGSLLPTLKGNARLGKGDFAVVEADEYKRAFLNYPSHVAVVTNVEADHLNYYRDIEDIRSAFRSFVGMVPRKGLVVACGDDPGARAVTENLTCCSLWYGVNPGNELRATRIRLSGQFTKFTVEHFDTPLATFELRVPGLHNVKNALAAIAVTSHLGVPLKHIQKALREFPGAWRRFEFKGQEAGVTVIDDYAHHPTELRATLEAARARFGKKRIVAIFQPHFYGRLRDFFMEFVKALQLADRVVIPPVFFVAGRENDALIRQRFNSQTLAAAVTKAGTPAVATPDHDSALVAALTGVTRGDVLMTIGAGNVTQLAPRILKKLATRK